MELSKLYMISLFEKYKYIDKTEIEKILNRNLSLIDTYMELKKLIKKSYN